MAMYNLQSNQIVVPPAVQEVIDQSVHHFLTAPQLRILFRHRNRFPVSNVTPVGTTGLFRVRSNYFRDDNAWNLAPNGHGVNITGVLNGAVRFNYTQAQGEGLMRRTIRNQQRYGNNTFIHYL